MAKYPFRKSGFWSLRAYAGSIDGAVWLALGTSVGTMGFAFGMGWVGIRKKKTVELNA